ncbi:MAG: hypothetical protein AMXMBFR84_24380 [Candidatus Hydrogenedentota bacterium]
MPDTTGRNSTRRLNAGFSLIELIAAFAVASAVLLGTMQLYYFGKTSAKSIEESAIARIAAQNEIETLRSMPYTSLVNGVGLPFRSTTPEFFELHLAAAEVTISDWSRAAGLKEIVVTARWIGAQGRPKQVKLTTLMGDLGT